MKCSRKLSHAGNNDSKRDGYRDRDDCDANDDVRDVKDDGDFKE